MIDTGSSRSFISPKKVNQYFNEYKYREVIYIHWNIRIRQSNISTHASSRHDEVIIIPLFPTFRTPEHHKFYIYDVDGRYDRLIGSDLLKQLDAKVDMKNKILYTY